MSASRALRAPLAALAIVTFAAGLARGDDAARNPPPDPDPGFLEFLGSVDGLAEVTPDYLARAERARVARLSVRGRAMPASPRPAPPPPPAPGVKNNE